jgi:hypothetical protein
MSQSQKSPLARLVLVMVCLSLAGSLCAGFIYFSVDLPMQKAMELKAPHNYSDACASWKATMGGCYLECSDKYPEHSWEIFSLVFYTYCEGWCDNTYGNNAHVCK